METRSSSTENATQVDKHKLKILHRIFLLKKKMYREMLKKKKMKRNSRKIIASKHLKDRKTGRLKNVIQPLLKKGVKGYPVKVALRQLSSQCTVCLQQLSLDQITKYTLRERRPLSRSTKDDSTSVNFDSSSRKCKTKITKKKYRRVQILSSDSETDNETPDNERISTNLLSEIHQNIQCNKSNRCCKTECNSEDMKDQTIETYTMALKQLRNEDKQNSSSLEKLENFPSNVNSYPVKDIPLPKTKQHDQNVSSDSKTKIFIPDQDKDTTDKKDPLNFSTKSNIDKNLTSCSNRDNHSRVPFDPTYSLSHAHERDKAKEDNKSSESSIKTSNNRCCDQRTVPNSQLKMSVSLPNNKLGNVLGKSIKLKTTREETQHELFHSKTNPDLHDPRVKHAKEYDRPKIVKVDTVTGKGIKCSKENIKDVDPKINNNVFFKHHKNNTSVYKHTNDSKVCQKSESTKLQVKNRLSSEQMPLKVSLKKESHSADKLNKYLTDKHIKISSDISEKNAKSSTAETVQYHHSHSFDKTVKNEQKEKEDTLELTISVCSKANKISHLEDKYSRPKGLHKNKDYQQHDPFNKTFKKANTKPKEKLNLKVEIDENSECKNSKEKGGNEAKIVGSVQTHRSDKSESIDYDTSAEITHKDKDKGSLNHSHKKTHGQNYLNKSHDEKLFKTEHKHKSDLTQKEKKGESVDCRTNKLSKSVSEKDSVFLSVDRRKSADDCKKEHIAEYEKINSKERKTAREHVNDKTCNEDKQDHMTLDARTNNSKSNICKMSPVIDSDKKLHLSSKQRIHSEKKTENDSIDKIHKSILSRKGSDVSDEKPNVYNKEKSSGDNKFDFPTRLDKTKIEYLKNYSKFDIINFTSTIKSRKDSRWDDCDEKFNLSIKERDNTSGSIKKTTDENKSNDKTIDVPLPSKLKKDICLNDNNEKQHCKKHRKSSTEDKQKDHNRKELHIESNSTIAKNNSSTERKSSSDNDQNNTNGAHIKITNENLVESKSNDDKRPSSSKPKKKISFNKYIEKHHKNRRKSSGEDIQIEISNESEGNDMITKKNSCFDIHDENQKLSTHTKESSSDNDHDSTSAYKKTEENKRSNISILSSKSKKEIGTNSGNEKDYSKKRRRSSTEDKQKDHNGKDLHNESKVNNTIEKTASSSNVHSENLKLPIHINQRSSNDNEQDNTSGSNKRKKETTTNDCNKKHCKKKRKSLEGSHEENDINGSRKRLKIEKFVYNTNDCKSGFTKSDNLFCKIINKQRQSSTEDNKNELKIESRVDKTKSRNNSGSENCDEQSNSCKEFDNKSHKRMKIENIVKSDIPKLESATDIGKSLNISKNIENNPEKQSTEIKHKTRKESVSDVLEEKITYKRSKSSIEEDEIKNNDFKDDNSSDSNKCSKSLVNVTDDSHLNSKLRKSEGNDSNHFKISDEDRKTQNLDPIVTNKLTCSIKIDSVVNLPDTKVHLLSPQRRTSTEILTNREIKWENIKDIETNCKSKTSITDFSSSTSKLNSKKSLISKPNSINDENTLLQAINVGPCTKSQVDLSNIKIETETTVCNEFLNSVDKSCKSDGGKKRKITEEHNLKNSENILFQINTLVPGSITEHNLTKNNFEEGTVVVNNQTISVLYKDIKENIECVKMDNSTSNTSTPGTLEGAQSLSNKEREIFTRVLIKEKCLPHCSRADSGLETGSTICVKDTEKEIIVNKNNSQLGIETICQNNLKNEMYLRKSISKDEPCIKETEKHIILNSNTNSVLDKATICLNNLKNDIDLRLKTSRTGFLIEGSAVNIPGERRKIVDVEGGQKNNSNDTKPQESKFVNVTVNEKLLNNQRDLNFISTAQVFNPINDTSSSYTDKMKVQNLTQSNDSTSTTFVTNTVSVVGSCTVDDSNKQEKSCLPLDVDVKIKSILSREVTDDKIHQDINSVTSESITDFSLQDIEKESKILNQPKQDENGLRVFDLSFGCGSTSLSKPKSSILRRPISICTKNESNTSENKENSDTVHRKSTEKQIQNIDLPQVKNFPVDRPTKNDITKTYEDNLKVVSRAETVKTVTVPNQNSTNIESEASKSPRHSKLLVPTVVNVKIVESISKEHSPNVCVRNDLNIASTSKDQNLGCRKFSDLRNVFEQKHTSDPQQNPPKLQHQTYNWLPRQNSISNIKKMSPTFQSWKKKLKPHNIPSKPVMHVPSIPLKGGLSNAKGTIQGKFYPNKNPLKSPTAQTQKKNLINLIGLTAEQVKLIKFKSTHDNSHTPTVSKSLNMSRNEQSFDHISKISKDDKLICNMNKEDKKKQIYMDLFGEDCDELETVNNTAMKISTSRKEDEESDCGNKHRADNSCSSVLPNKSPIEIQNKMNMKISSISKKDSEESDCGNKQRADNSCSSVLPNKSPIEIQNKMNMKISSISKKNNEDSDCGNKYKVDDSCSSVLPNKSPIKIQNKMNMKISSISKWDNEESDCGNKHKADDSCSSVLPKKSPIKIQNKMNMKISPISKKANEESDRGNKHRADDSCSSVLSNKFPIEIQNKMNIQISSVSRKDDEESDCGNKQRADDSCSFVLSNKSSIDIQNKMNIEISSVSRKNDEESDCGNKHRADDSCSSVLPNKSPIEIQNKMNIPSVQCRIVQAPAKTGNKCLNKASIIKVMNELTADANKFIGKSKNMSMKQKEIQHSKEPLNSNEFYNHVLPSMPSIDDSVSIQDFLKTLDGESCTVHQDFDSQKACTLYKAPEDSETSDPKTSRTKQLSCTLSIEGSKVVSGLLISQSSTLSSELKNKASDHNSDNLQSEIPPTVLNNTENQKQLGSESIIVMNESNVEETTGDNKKSAENDSLLDKTITNLVVKLDICEEAIVSSSTVSPEPVTVSNIETNVSLNNESKIGKIRVKDARELGIQTRDDFCPSQINYLRRLSASNETFTPCNTFVVVPKENNLFVDGQVTSTVPDISPVVDVVTSSSESSESLTLNDKDSDVQNVNTSPVDHTVNYAPPVQEVNITVKTCANVKSNTPSIEENCLKMEDIKEESTTDANNEQNITTVKSGEELETVSQPNEQLPIETNVPSNCNNIISETLPPNFEQNSLEMSSRTNRPSSQNNDQNYVQRHSSLNEQNHITNSQSVTVIPSQNHVLSTENIEQNRAQGTKSSQNKEYGHVVWPPVENFSSNLTNLNSTSRELQIEIFSKLMINMINSTNGDWTKNNLKCARIYNAVFDNSAMLICKLAEILHLVITYKEAMIPQISKCLKLKSDSLIKNETNRIEKAYQENVLMRGKDFYTLFSDIYKKIVINSKEQHFIDLVFILYIKIINDLIKIDTTHRAYVFKARNIITEMMTAIGVTNLVIFTLLNSEDEQFIRRYTLVRENLLQIYNSEQLRQLLTHTSSVTSTITNHNTNTHSDPNQTTVSTHNLNHSQSLSNENQPVNSSPHLNDFNDTVFVDLSSPEPLTNIEQENIFRECNETIINANVNNYFGQTDMIDYSLLQPPNKRRANSNIEQLTNMTNSLSPIRSSRNGNYVEITNSNKQNTNSSEINLMSSPQSNPQAGGMVSNTYVPSNNEQMGCNSVNNDYYRSRTSRRNSEPTYVPASSAFHQSNLLRGMSLMENTSTASNNMYNNPKNITASQEPSQIQNVIPNQPIGFLPQLPSTQSYNTNQGSIQTQNNQFLHPSTSAYHEWLRRNQQVQIPEQHYRSSTSQRVLQPAEHARQIYAPFSYTNNSSRVGAPPLHPGNAQLVRLPMFTSPNHTMYSLPNVQQNPQVGFTNIVQRCNSVANVAPPRQMCYFPPCNNPATKHCNTCNKVFYCSNECQKKDWKHQHYLTCI